MFKKSGCLFVLILIALIFVSGMFGATQKQTFRYKYPDNALYETVPVNYDAPAASSTAKIITGINISSYTLTSYTTGFNMTISAQTDYPRNFSVKVTSGVSIFTGYFVVTGTDSTGTSRSETLTLTSTVTSSTTVESNYAFGYVKTCVLIVSTFTALTAGHTEFYIQVGVGVKLGLPTSIQRANDLVTCLENGAATTTLSKCNATYNTIDFAADPDGTKDYEIVFIAPLRQRNLGGE